MAIAFEQLHGELRLNEPLDKYTSWRVGGRAKQFYRPKNIADLALFISQLPPEEPILWLGLGSNFLVRDGGYSGTVISTAGTLQNIDITDQTIHAEVGVYCSKLAKKSARAGLSGAAFLAGIPGTIGGALAMNAGAHQSETWSLVKEVTTVDRHGELHRRMPTDFTIGYRYVSGPRDEWFVSAVFHLETGDADTELAHIKALLKKRNATQPTNQPCAGSVFRNPDNDFAGRLIESTGLKGLSIGGAHVSEKHANFIVNDGSAKASDIEHLMALVQQKVAAEHGIQLQPEIHIIGDKA